MRPSSAQSPRFDPISLQILWNRLISAVDEMAAMVSRTSFSPLVRESHDFSCGILDPNAQGLALSSKHVPVFTGSMPVIVTHLLREFPDLSPGDVLVSNEPWIGTGQLNDLCVCTPVFYRDKLVALMATIAHVSDIGGLAWSAAAADVYEEGLCIPPCKLYEAGRPNRDVFGFIRYNVRVPDEVMGDVEAMVVGNEVGARRIRSMLEEHALDDLDELGAEVHARTEAAFRQAIQAIPPGIYRHAIELDGFDAPVRIQIAVEVIADGSIVIDYTGSSAQVPHAINCVENYSRSFSFFALKSALLPHIPNNAGALRPVEIRAPQGSIMNAVRPASLSARHLTGHACASAVLGALAEVVPERVIAHSCEPLWVLNFSGFNRGRPFNSPILLNGGLGARFSKDGLTCVMFPAGSANTPIEILESHNPNLFECKEFRQDSGGAGRCRGGLGQHIRIRIGGDQPQRLALHTDRINHPPLGFSGGRAGATGAVSINGLPQHGKSVVYLKPGDVVDVQSPGGGGFHNPTDRDPKLVSSDLRNEFISQHEAESVYGMNIADDSLGELNQQPDTSRRLHAPTR